MIYLVSVKNRKMKNGRWYYDEAPEAKIAVIRRPFAFVSAGPLITGEESAKAYRRWLFKKLLFHYATQEEFSFMLEILYHEGDLVLECSCLGPFCHGNIVKDALIWAEPFGFKGWHDQLKSNVSK